MLLLLSFSHSEGQHSCLRLRGSKLQNYLPELAEALHLPEEFSYFQRQKQENHNKMYMGRASQK